MEATFCYDCPASEEGCSSGDCTWMPNTEKCTDAWADDIRTASVHLFYPKPPQIEDVAWWFQRVIPTADADNTYWSTNGHRFGYGGIQRKNAEEGKVLFSLWDQGGCDRDLGECDGHNVAQTVACGSGVACSDFGGEGTGRKSYITTSPPNLNQAYYFVTQAAYLGDRRMEYTGYFLDGSQWRLLSRIQVSTNEAEEWSIKGLYSFVEQWTAIQAMTERSAMFGPSFVSDTDGTEWVQIESASFGHNTRINHEHVNMWQAGSEFDHAIGIATGGDVEPNASSGIVSATRRSILTRNLTASKRSFHVLTKQRTKTLLRLALEPEKQTSARMVI